jgi:hypothetical protein
VLASLVRRLRERRSRLKSVDLEALARGSGWERLAHDPTFDLIQRMAESPGGQPPRVRW